MPPRKRAAKAVAAPAAPVRARPTSRQTARDAEFIVDHKYEFRVYEGQLVWNGRARDLGSPFQLPPDQHRCTHEVTRRDGEGKAILDADLRELKIRCPKWGMLLGEGKGTLHLCFDHAGGVAGVRLAVQARLAAAADAMAGRLIDIALSEATDAADAIRAIKEALDRVGIRGGIEISPDIPGWQAVITEYMEGSRGGEDSGAEGR